MTVHVAVVTFNFRPIIDRWVQFNFLLSQWGVRVPILVVSRTISVEMTSIAVSISASFAVVIPPRRAIAMILPLVSTAGSVGGIAILSLQLQKSFLLPGNLSSVRHKGGLPMVKGGTVIDFWQDSRFGRVLGLSQSCEKRSCARADAPLLQVRVE